jgi:hypothetical protein
MWCVSCKYNKQPKTSLTPTVTWRWTIIIIVVIVIIIYLTCSWATCWSVPVSHIQMSLQWSSLVPSAFGLLFLLPWVIWHSVFMLQPIPTVFLYFVKKVGLYLIHLQSLYLIYDLPKSILMFFSYFSSLWTIHVEIRRTSSFTAIITIFKRIIQ